jgi:hypothetical protein
MDLPSPGYTPHCLCHLRLDHPGLRRSGSLPPKGLGPFWALHTLRTPPGNIHEAWSQTDISYLAPGTLPSRLFPRMVASLEPGTLWFFLFELCPPSQGTFYPVPILLGISKFISCLLRATAVTVCTTMPGHPCFSIILETILVLTERHGQVLNTPASYSANHVFKSRPWDQLS